MGKMPKAVQAKHIPNAVFLNAVRDAVNITGRPANYCDITYLLIGRPDFVKLQMIADNNPGINFHVDYETLISQKVLRAKARKLIRRGVLYGCYCGCRGDFTILGPRGGLSWEARNL